MSRVEKALKAADETQALEIGANILDRVVALFREQFPRARAVVVADENTYRVAGRQVRDLLEAGGIQQDEPFIFTDPGLYAEFRFIDRLTDFLMHTDAIPVAVGSGTVNDLTKLSSFKAGRRYMCVATAASMDGYTAYGASITADGAKQTFDCPAPQAVLADTHIIGEAPQQMTASGYSDLFAKVTAGADWILADTLGVEPIHDFAWEVVQGGLKDALADPEGAKAGNHQAIRQLVEGLMLGGFAMQATRSSRPASGAEHQFSHLLDMEHHRYQGVTPSHGFKVAVGMLAVTAFYEQMFADDLSKLDIEACCRCWQPLAVQEEKALALFAGSDFPTIGAKEVAAKYVTREELAGQLGELRNRWPEIRKRLQEQLVPYAEVKRRLKLVGAPVEPEEIGVSRARLRECFIKAQYIRRRFTVLDVAVRACRMEKWLDGLFGKGGIWAC